MRSSSQRRRRPESTATRRQAPRPTPAAPVPASRIPVLLLTGFLGAGKTTLLLRWLREAPATGRRVGIVMNEFGLESVDSQLISRPGLPLEQVDGGCICCADDSTIGNAIRRLARSGKVDFIVVETSGLADPDNVIDVLTDIDLLPDVRLQSIVTVVDGLWFARESIDSGERVLARKQIEFAHVLALSKCDQLSPDEADRARDDLHKLNPRADQVRLPYGLPEPGRLLAQPSGEWLEPSGKEAPPASAEPHLHTAYRSLTWTPPAPVDRSAFEGFLTGLHAREVPRAKGFIRFRQTPDRLHVFQSVFGNHYIEEFPATPLPPPVVVLIGPCLDIPRHQAALRALAYGRNTIALAAGNR